MLDYDFATTRDWSLNELTLHSYRSSIGNDLALMPFVSCLSYIYYNISCERMNIDRLRVLGACFRLSQ